MKHGNAFNKTEINLKFRPGTFTTVLQLVLCPSVVNNTPALDYKRRVQ